MPEQYPIFKKSLLYPKVFSMLVARNDKLARDIFYSQGNGKGSQGLSNCNIFNIFPGCVWILPFWYASSTPRANLTPFGAGQLIGGAGLLS
jgi:hypothetical protein